MNIPKNQNIICRLPRTSTLAAPPAVETGTSGPEAAVGFLIDGVSMFDCTDGFSWTGSAEVGGNTGQWHRDAYVHEGMTLDYGNTHQQNTGMYHNHANPLALRYQMGDHIFYNSTTKRYSETAGTPIKHSPLLGWMRDGFPIYGPLGYSTALDASSGIRRMVSEFVKRDGTTTGVDNITVIGPSVSTTYPLARYIEDNANLGDLVKSGVTKYAQGTDFDLNEYNVRYCATPEFPGGTSAYFMPLDASGAPAFPYHCNRYFFGTPTATTLTSIAETVTDYFLGGPNIQEGAKISNVDSTSGDVTLVWSSVEGGTYQVKASDNHSDWSGVSTSHPKRFYQVGRTALTNHDG